MAFEVVTITYANGRKQPGVSWAALPTLIQRRELPSNAMLLDERTGQQAPVEAFPELLALIRAPSAGDATGGLIPYKNKPALIGYYLGVFSVFACLPFVGVIGIGMAIAAIVLGFKGLKVVRQTPECRGTAHAWVAIIAGIVCLVSGLAINGAMIAGVVASAMQHR